MKNNIANEISTCKNNYIAIMKTQKISILGKGIYIGKKGVD